MEEGKEKKRVRGRDTPEARSGWLSSKWLVFIKAGRAARSSKVLREALEDKRHPSQPSYSLAGDRSWALNKYLLTAYERCPPLLPSGRHTSSQLGNKAQNLVPGLQLTAALVASCQPYSLREPTSSHQDPGWDKEQPVPT